MGLNLKSAEVARLAAEVAELAKETKTEAIRKALVERKARLLALNASGRAGLRAVLQEEIWPEIPRRLLGRKRSSWKAEDKILGYGKRGV